MLMFLIGALGLGGLTALRAWLTRSPGYCAECASFWGQHELHCSRYCEPAVEDTAPEPPRFDYEAYELQLWMDNPLAVWLDPTRWERPAWPALPTEADLRYDGSAVDKAVAFVTMPAALQHKLEQTHHNARRRITSSRQWDRFQGTIYGQPASMGDYHELMRKLRRER